MKARSYPVELLRLKRLHARMYPDDLGRAFVGERIDRAEAGYKGETTVDNYLHGLRLPGTVTLLQNVRLQIHEDYIAQFDTLVITERGIWIIEAKMIRGSLRLLGNPRRMERVDESGRVLTMDCPILQLENQKTGLAEWLAGQELSIPVGGVVAFATRNTWEGLPEDAPIVSVKELKSWLISSVKRSPQPDSRYSPLETIIKQIHAGELGPDMRTFEEMSIRHGPLKKGLLCESCFFGLDRVSERKYECLNCEVRVVGDPVGRALLDYFLLIKPRITNREFSEFVGLRWRSTGNRYLKRYELDVKGNVYSFDPRRHLEGKSLKSVGTKEGQRHLGGEKEHSGEILGHSYPFLMHSRRK